jgi:DNA-binding transcriptional LysR family regulator
MLNAALAGFGLAYVTEDLARPHLTKGRFRRVLADWCPSYAGYHLYYPSRRQLTPAFTLLVEALRYRAPVPLKSGLANDQGAEVRCIRL